MPHAHPLVLAMDFRVSDPALVWPLLQERRAELAALGAHHVLVYTSGHDHGRVLLTIGLRSREPVMEVLRSRLFLDWFDAIGVDDIPAVFAGETVEKFAVAEPDPAQLPGVIVAVLAPVEDVPTLIARTREARTRLGLAKIRSLRIFQAFDDEHEILMLQEVDNEEDARSWVDHPDAVAAWMAGAGVGAYPPVFIGTFEHMLRIDEND